MGLGEFWLVFSAVQLVVAGYVLAAVLSWRGARFRPAPGHPFALVPTALVVAAAVVVVVALVVVGDADLARWLGTGGLMLVAVVSLVVLSRAHENRG